MRRVLFLLPLLFAGCSCQPDPVADGRHPGVAPTEGTAQGQQTGQEAGDGITAIAPPVLSAVAADAVNESLTVRNYVTALLGSDRSASDAFWKGGRPGPRPDDSVLRGIKQLRNLRVDTESPIARDTAQPSRLREVPVRIRAITAEGTFRYQGWYRLQPRPDGSGWEIQSASLQPALD